MTQEIRLDAVGRLGKAERTPQGGVRIPASLTRAGVLEYRDPSFPGGMRREWRPAAEVFREDAIRAIESLPVIVGHSAWVTPTNYREVTRGVVDAGSAKRRGTFLDGRVTVQDADALRRCDTGELCDLSLGYSLKYTPGAGIVPDGEPDAGKRYDGVQSNLIANHVALLPSGAARAEVGFRFDAKDDPLSGAPVLFSELPAVPDSPQQERKRMALIVRLDSKEYDLATPEGVAAHGAAVDKIRQDARDADTRAAKAEGERDGYKATIATLELQLKDTTRLDGLVSERVRVEGVALNVLGKDYSPKGKTNREIQIDVIRHDAKDFNDKGPDGQPRPDAYIEARFDSILEHVTPTESIHNLRTLIDPSRPPVTRQDTRDQPRISRSEQARIANEEAMQNAWRTSRA